MKITLTYTGNNEQGCVQMFFVGGSAHMWQLQKIQIMGTRHDLFLFSGLLVWATAFNQIVQKNSAELNTTNKILEKQGLILPARKSVKIF